MDTLKNKAFGTFDYDSRYAYVPYYYDTLCDREVFGHGSNVFTNTAFLSHKVVPTDTLDSLALKYYNNPTYWWYIAYFNNIEDPFDRLIDKFSTIKIPGKTSLTFGNER